MVNIKILTENTIMLFNSPEPLTVLIPVLQDLLTRVSTTANGTKRVLITGRRGPGKRVQRIVEGLPVYFDFKDIKVNLGPAHQCTATITVNLN